MVADFLAGKSSGLESVYAAYGRPLYSVARDVLGNDDDAQDCVHDALVRIWQRPGSYRPERGSLRKPSKLLAQLTDGVSQPCGCPDSSARCRQGVRESSNAGGQCLPLRVARRDPACVPAVRHTTFRWVRPRSSEP
jgi:hypothetical protein